ncbi:MAG: adenosylcobinamide-phosphate synthase CbiB [Thermodesulfovibrionales bacterium]
MIEIQSSFSLQPLVLIMAFLLDLAIGDPRWLPHPVRIMGSAIAKTEKILRTEDRGQKTEDRLKGVFLVFIIVGLTFGLTWLIVYALTKIGNISSLMSYFSGALLVYLTSTTIAIRELIDSARDVIKALKKGDIKLARKNLSMIVGRDTENLSEKGVLKATIETLSENLSDGIIAPLFYLSIGGIPLAMAYKAINTLDSMVGYKNAKYIDFGWASARLDDIANYIPARISGVLIVISIFFITIFKCPSHASRITHYALRVMINDGRKHLSPNSGIPEAAMAGALGVRLGGPSRYNGVEVQKPYIGEEKTEDYLTASERALMIIKSASIIAICITGVFLYAK